MSITFANDHSATMSKFIVFYCVVLVASSVYGAALEKQLLRSNEAVKEDCIRSINQVFADMLQLLKDFYADSDHQDYYRARLSVLLRDGSEAMNRVIKKVNKTESIITVRSGSIFPEHPVLCAGNIVEELAQIVNDLLHLNPRKEVIVTVN